MGDKEMKLWKVTVERNQEAILFVEAESADRAEHYARMTDLDWDSVDADEFAAAAPKSIEQPNDGEGMQEVVLRDPFEDECTVDEWLLRRAGAERVVGTAPYRRVIEAAGQLTLDAALSREGRHG